MKNLMPTMLATFLVSITMLTMMTLIYLIWLEQPYLSYTNLPLPLLKDRIYAGEQLPLRVNRCNTSKQTQTYMVARSLHNLDVPSDVIALESTAVSVLPGCTSDVTLLHRIPVFVEPGHYQLRGVAMVPGLIRNFLVEWHSEPFTVRTIGQ